MTEGVLLLIRLLLQTTAYVIYSLITQSAKHIHPNPAKHWSIKLCFKDMHNSKQVFLQYFSSADVKELHKGDNHCLHRRKLRLRESKSLTILHWDLMLWGPIWCSAQCFTILCSCWLPNVIITCPDFSGTTCQKHMLTIKIVEGAWMLPNNIFTVRPW